jgi:hypothetical protein
MPIIITWVFFLFIDAWKVIVFNKNTISLYILGIRLASIQCHDIIKIKIKKTNQFINLEQGTIVCLYDKNHREIAISQKMDRYDFFGKFVKEHIAMANGLELM